MGGYFDLRPLSFKGWYELSRLQPSDRVEFTRDYWISKLPYHPTSLDSITRFFERIEDIGIVIAQKHFNDRNQAHMIYALKEGSGFFHGGPAMTDEESVALQESYEDVILPEDYICLYGDP